MSEQHTPKFPHVTVQLSGRDGNAGAIMGAVTSAMKAAGISAADISAYRVASISGDYDNLLRVAMETVNVK